MPAIAVRNKKWILFLLVAAFLFMSLCTMTSYLFPLHSRVDQNIFFTIGRELLNGKVLYRDLFDHKGPLIYFMHAFAAMISETTFIGVFLLEVLFFAVLMYYIYKIALLFASKQNAACTAVLSGALIATASCFKRGDNAEEFCLTFFAVSLFYLLRYFKERENHTGTSDGPVCMRYRLILFYGLLAGCVLWIKFTLLGFWIVWMAAVFFICCMQKQYARGVISCLVFLGGMLITAIPWFLYFWRCDAVAVWLQTYFYANIFQYTAEADLTQRLLVLIERVGYDLAVNPLLWFTILWGIAKFSFTKQYFRLKIHRIVFAVSFFFSYFILYIGGVGYDYYMLIVAVFTMFGISDIWERIQKRRKNAGIPAEGAAAGRKAEKRFLLFFAAVICGIALLSNCLPYYGKSRQDYPQYLFAEEMQKSENPTLLNYGFIDQGFYFAAGIRPINQFFCKVNIPRSGLPEMYEEQETLVQRREVEFVVVRMNKGEDFSTLLHAEKYTASPYQVDYTLLPAGYEVVRYGEDPFENYKFALLRRTDR